MVHLGSSVKVWQLYLTLLLSTYQITGGFVQIGRDITFITRRRRSVHVFDPIIWTPYRKCHSPSNIPIEKSSSNQVLFAASPVISDEVGESSMRNVLSDGQSYLPKGITKSEILKFSSLHVECASAFRAGDSLPISPMVRKDLILIIIMSQ